MIKVNNLEKQKSRLQSEVEVLIIDLEKANNTARELQKRVEQLERINIDLKTRLDETIQLYEQSQRDLRTKISELQRTVHELDKTREQKDQLARENKKLAGKWNVKEHESSTQRMSMCPICAIFCFLFCWLFMSKVALDEKGHYSKVNSLCLLVD